MNILAKQPFDSALRYLHTTRPLVLIPAFEPHLTYEANRARTRTLAGDVHLISRGGWVFTGWTRGLRDALIAPPICQPRAGAVPAIKYPIVQLLEHLIEEYSSSEAVFVERILGYHNREIAKGSARLRRWLEHGEGPNSIIKAVGWATNREPELREAIAASERMKQEHAAAEIMKQLEQNHYFFRPANEHNLLLVSKDTPTQ